MEKTGQTFEMNVESFTLQSIFAMELHRFQDKIAEIVNCAIKELAIEKVFIFYRVTQLQVKEREGKERKSIYIAPFIYYVYLKALTHGSHSFTCKYTMPAFPS